MTKNLEEHCRYIKHDITMLKDVGLSRKNTVHLDSFLYDNAVSNLLVA